MGHSQAVKQPKIIFLAMGNQEEEEGWIRHVNNFTTTAFGWGRDRRERERGSSLRGVAAAAG